eukprot:344564-Amphidinium_carterae.1
MFPKSLDIIRMVQCRNKRGDVLYFAQGMKQIITRPVLDHIGILEVAPHRLQGVPVGGGEDNALSEIATPTMRF